MDNFKHGFKSAMMAQSQHAVGVSRCMMQSLKLSEEGTHRTLAAKQKGCRQCRTQSDARRRLWTRLHSEMPSASVDAETAGGGGRCGGVCFDRCLAAAAALLTQHALSCLSPPVAAQHLHQFVLQPQHYTLGMLCPAPLLPLRLLVLLEDTMACPACRHLLHTQTKPRQIVIRMTNAADRGALLACVMDWSQGMMSSYSEGSKLVMPPLTPALPCSSHLQTHGRS